MDARVQLATHGPLARLNDCAAPRWPAPLAVAVLTIWAAPQQFATAGAGAADGGIVTAFGPLVYRLAYQSLADATSLVLLIVSVGVHFAMTGLGLLFFGAEGFRNPSFWDERICLGPLCISGQALIIMATSVALIVLLYQFFEPHAVRQGPASHRGQPPGCAADGHFDPRCGQPRLPWPR
jgi:branched-chain amino acid transport system permease protein